MSETNTPVLTRDIGWLIERNDLEVKPLWYWDDPYKPGWHDWTRVAADARRFASKEEAEAFEPYRMIASDPNITVTEHVFLAHPQITP